METESVSLDQTDLKFLCKLGSSYKPHFINLRFVRFQDYYTTEYVLYVHIYVCTLKKLN